MSLSSGVIQYAINQGLFCENKGLADAFLKEKSSFSHLKAWLIAFPQGFLARCSGRSARAEMVKRYIEQCYCLEETPESFQHKRSLPIPDMMLQSERADYQEAFSAIHHNWPRLVRQSPSQAQGSLIPLPHPYVVPGGRFKEMYYWDSYFTLLGLQVSGLHDLARGMVDNCLHLVEQYGRIPNGNRTYYLTRSQPPFLTSMIKACRAEGDISWLQRAFHLAKQEYHQTWMDAKSHYLPSYGLNRYYDPTGQRRPESWGDDNIHTPNTEAFFRHERAECESGWDFTDRFDARCADFLPIDLNCLLYQYEKDFAQFAGQLGLTRESRRWEQKAQARKRRIQTLCWHEKDGLFYDYDTRHERPSRYASLASYFPLWVGLATPAQAKRIVKHLSRFEGPGGLTTSLKNSGKQWDAPNGWAPLQWIVIQGLQRYGFETEAKRIAQKWVDLCTQAYQRDGKFYEKYNVLDCNLETPGGYPLQDGFGWTNAIYQKLVTEILGHPVLEMPQKVVSMQDYQNDVQAIEAQR